jgi:hypothetical protein
MAKLTRVIQKIFGINAAQNEMAVFGSLNAGSPAFTKDPKTIQSLVNFLNGLRAGVVGNNSPALEDINALYYLMTFK